MARPDDENDDLDDLLDDCMNTINEQERQHEERVRERNAAREAEVLKNMDPSFSACSGPGETEIAHLIQNLMGCGTADEKEDGSSEADPVAALDKLKTDIDGMLSSMLENMPELAEEERKNLVQLQQMLETMDESIEAAPDLSTMQNVENAQMVDELMNEFKKLSEQHGCRTDTSGTDDSGTSPLSNLHHLSGRQQEDAAQTVDQMANLLLKSVMDSEFRTQFKEMRKYYPIWLAKNESRTNAEDLVRYRAQERVLAAICDLLDEGSVNHIDGSKITELTAFMDEFSSLAPPPPGLHNISLE